MRTFQVDTFTDEPFRGNPAAVCMLAEPKSEAWMRSVANELNLPVTAFIQMQDEVKPFNLRWFTPYMEIPLCGHGTLASAHILYELNIVSKKEPITFITKGGELTTEIKQDWIGLNFPLKPDREIDPPELLEKAIGIKPKYVGKNELDYIVEVEEEDVVKNLQPDINLISKLAVRGVIVTSLCHSGKYDFISRFFSPAQGIEEDAVTGSAHCCLASFWKRRLNKNIFMAFQDSAREAL